MAKYVYPAIFSKEENGLYSIVFPDFEACFTQGDDIQEGLFMANDVLCLTLYDMEENKEDIPVPSDPLQIKANENEFVTLVSCDTMEYRKFYDNKAVKKTLTIPSWLNTMAEREGVNFSQVLQESLKDRLQL
ncbi:type II toxin-antitoxin system HicB family antitoxin [Tissierella pigra]|uniref:Type II toxin-antitoxin system HicB family antitoxin n=1 Tax=Tissierella pigra TaxID=2607614 RepID=A0A6N7Y034_9FIRM|nr:type II toxin-antitoxin system HicB family antitoxin [Tissierella pigra]MSU03103.1 type II toxin-antitoxin system HicB family antitoxin [Tissierella pigra]